ncbi:MAG: hypothetical protein ACSNEK_04830 [Parachlamydiaceae bacterium]
MSIFNWRKVAWLLSIASTLQAGPDISNFNNCINEICIAENLSIAIPTFDDYMTNYQQLIDDLEEKAKNLPHIYQKTAAQPLIQFLQNLGELKYLQLFNGESTDPQSSTLKRIIPDAALSILSHEGVIKESVHAFQQIVSDLYDSFLSEEVRVGNQAGRAIALPTYSAIPPLVKFGNANSGPYTWTVSTTSKLLGMQCAVVSLPPAQLKGGLLAWLCLGHETTGHDVIHADEGLIEELAQKVHHAVLKKFRSHRLANYWSKCIDESVADVCGYLNMGPSAAVGLIGYFRALGDGKLQSVGSINDSHPIGLLRGYLAAAVINRLHFKEAKVWSQLITTETSKDDSRLYFKDESGVHCHFPVSFKEAVASTEVVAKTIMQSKLSALQGHSLQELKDWTDKDQEIVDRFVEVLKGQEELPENLQSPQFYAAYVVAAAAQAALEQGANITALFNRMQSILSAMYRGNPTWSQEPSDEALTYLEKMQKRQPINNQILVPHETVSHLFAR